MAEKATKEAPEDTVWLPPDADWAKKELFSDYAGRGLGQTDNSATCCGVLELGACAHGKIKARMHSKEQTKRPANRPTWYYHEPKPVWTRPATQEEIEAGFKAFVESRSQRSGMIVCYLRENQHRGDFARLLEGSGFTFLSKFWNPNTRHNLYHWVKVLHKEPRKRKGKRTLLASEPQEVVCDSTSNAPAVSTE